MRNGNKEYVKTINALYSCFLNLFCINRRPHPIHQADKMETKVIDRDCKIDRTTWEKVNEHEWSIVYEPQMVFFHYSHDLCSAFRTH